MSAMDAIAHRDLESQSLQEVEMEDAGEDLFCAKCWSKCKGKWQGRWQQIKLENGQKWVYLCRRCDRDLWRLFDGLEEWHDKAHMYSEYNRFLAIEFNCD